MKTRPDVERMGEHYVGFCALKVIEKLIDGSGLDQAFDEAGKWTLSNKQYIRLMTSVTWLTYACLKPCLNYDISNSCLFVLDHCVHAIHFILRYDSSSQVTLIPSLLYVHIRWSPWDLQYSTLTSCTCAHFILMLAHHWG